MLDKKYPQDCAIDGPNWQPIIMITHDKNIFSVNNGRHHAWIEEGHNMLCPKKRAKASWLSIFCFLGHI